jgi:hypothetical protein
VVAGGAWLGGRSLRRAENGAEEEPPRASPATRVGRRPPPVFLPAGGSASGERVPSWFAQPDLPAGEIAGQVVRDGHAVAGVEVTLESQASAANPALLRRTVSRDDGHFSFGRQPPGAFEVMATAADSEPVHLRVDLRDPLARPRSDRLLVALSPCRATISGLVTDRESGVALVGARVLALPASDPATVAGPATLTGASGEYEFCVVPGALRLRVEAVGHAFTLVLLSEEELERRDVQLLPEVLLAGRTVDGATGAPLAEVQVNARPLGDDEPAAGPSTTLSDTQGRFILRGLRARTRYSIDAWRSDYVSEEPMTVELPPGAGHEVVRKLAAASRVSGVIEQQGRPVPGARIRADRLPYAHSFISISQADGRFTLHGVPRGTDTLLVEGFRVLGPARLEVGAEPRRDLVVDVQPLRR